MEKMKKMNFNEFDIDENDTDIDFDDQDKINPFEKIEKINASNSNSIDILNQTIFAIFELKNYSIHLNKLLSKTIIFETINNGFVMRGFIFLGPKLIIQIEYKNSTSRETIDIYFKNIIDLIFIEYCSLNEFKKYQIFNLTNFYSESINEMINYAKSLNCINSLYCATHLNCANHLNCNDHPHCDNTQKLTTETKTCCVCDSELVHEGYLFGYCYHCDQYMLCEQWNFKIETDFLMKLAWLEFNLENAKIIKHIKNSNFSEYYSLMSEINKTIEIQFETINDMGAYGFLDPEIDWNEAENIYGNTIYHFIKND